MEGTKKYGKRTSFSSANKEQNNCQTTNKNTQSSPNNAYKPLSASSNASSCSNNSSSAILFDELRATPIAAVEKSEFEWESTNYDQPSPSPPVEIALNNKLTFAAKSPSSSKPSTPLSAHKSKSFSRLAVPNHSTISPAKFTAPAPSALNRSASSPLNNFSPAKSQSLKRSSVRSPASPGSAGLKRTKSDRSGSGSGSKAEATAKSIHSGDSSANSSALARRISLNSSFSVSPVKSLNFSRSSSDLSHLHGELRQQADELIYLIDGTRKSQDLRVRHLSARKLLELIISQQKESFFLLRTANCYENLAESFVEDYCVDDSYLESVFCALCYLASKEKANAQHFIVKIIKTLIKTALSPIPRYQNSANSTENGANNAADSNPGAIRRCKRKTAANETEGIEKFFAADEILVELGLPWSSSLLALLCLANCSEDLRFKQILIASHSEICFAECISHDFQQFLAVKNSFSAEKKGILALLQHRMSCSLLILENLTQNNTKFQNLLLDLRVHSNETVNFDESIDFLALSEAFVESSRQKDNAVAVFDPFEGMNSAGNNLENSQTQPMEQQSFDSLLNIDKIHFLAIIFSILRHHLADFSSCGASAHNLNVLILRLLVNLTHKSARGCSAMNENQILYDKSTGNAVEIIVKLSEMCWKVIEQQKNSDSSDCSDELTVALGLLINLAESSSSTRDFLLQSNLKLVNFPTCCAFLVDIFTQSYLILRRIGLEQLEKAKISANSGESKENGESMDEKQESLALSSRISCSYAALLLGIMATHSGSAGESAVQLELTIQHEKFGEIGLEEAERMYQEQEQRAKEGKVQKEKERKEAEEKLADAEEGGSEGNKIISNKSEREAPEAAEIPPLAINFRLVIRVLKEFLVLQSDATVLTQDALDVMFSLIEKLEKQLNRKNSLLNFSRNNSNPV
jgi:hypothetical protein